MSSDTLFAVDPPLYRSAVLSDDGLYRYSLNRWWDNELPSDLWIMCNPSTADAAIDDATIRRCIGFSRAFGAGGFTVVNAYGYRATKPAAMWAAQASGVDINGPENDAWITAHCMTKSKEGRVIVAWGAHPRPDRCRAVYELIRAQDRQPVCLGTTKAGQPRHPLMLANATQLENWRPAA